DPHERVLVRRPRTDPTREGLDRAREPLALALEPRVEAMLARGPDLAAADRLADQRREGGEAQGPFEADPPVEALPLALERGASDHVAPALGQRVVAEADARAAGRTEAILAVDL